MSGTTFTDYEKLNMNRWHQLVTKWKFKELI